MPSRHRTIVRAIQSDLEPLAEEKTRVWWEKYLKGEASFRGVKMAGVRQVVAAAWTRHDLAAESAESLIDLARALMAEPDTEDKLAGVLLLTEHAMDHLAIEHVDTLGEPLADGSLADWNSVDWYCVKALASFLVAGHDVRKRAQAIAAWRDAETLWQRRAAAVAFVPHAPKPPPFKDFDALLLRVCRANVADPTRWSQTSVGWLLREMAHRVPDTVRAFVDEHPEMSTEARRNALKHLG